ncbi:hypothetical protein Taro_002802 [Colocasia esculenta]|uniref:Uncharacterized protein n=1 Tax=Colocasia esculenta TaxID=4460 RepID=A0A843TMJ2_COLES|nr:hypothetical protein [Colocasia esculenta]
MRGARGPRCTPPSTAARTLPRRCHLQSLNAGRQPTMFPPEGPKGTPCPGAHAYMPTVATETPEADQVLSRPPKPF